MQPTSGHLANRWPLFSCPLANSANPRYHTRQDKARRTRSTTCQPPPKVPRFRHGTQLATHWAIIMATLYVTICDVGARTSFGDTDIGRSGSFRSETITTSGASASGALVARRGQIAKVFCLTQTYVKAGPPAGLTAAMATGLYVAPGQPEWISLQEGDVIAAIDA